MLNDSILVTVLMPVYNGQSFLRAAIDSILNQTYTHIELLIINDGSLDDSEKIIQSYKDERIVYVKNDRNIGLIETLNKGLLFAKGKYIARMDADDISLPNRLEKQVCFLEENPAFGLLGTGYSIFGDKEEEVHYPSEHEKLKIACLSYNPFCHPSVMIRKAVLDEFNLKFQKEYIHAEEYKLWTEILSVTKCHNLQEILLKYRFHSSQISQVHLVKQLEITQKIQIEYLKNVGFSLTDKNLNVLDFLSHKLTNLTAVFANDLLDGIEKIIDQNREIDFFDKKLLENFLYINYKNILLEVDNIDKKLFKKYRKTLNIENITWTKRQKISILIKFLKRT
jgi:glycosyltransferase involved in cell wall biosynthesis